MKIFPNHKPVPIAIAFAGAIVVYVVLSSLARSDNDNITSLSPSKLPYADLVAVEPGSQLFYTWGVTASPRFKEIAKGDVENRYGNTYEQSYSVLSQLSYDLAEVGLTLRDVVNVRAYIVADPEPDFDSWNKAFSEFFGTVNNPSKPARTTLGISRLFLPDYRVEVEFTAVFPSGRGPLVDGTRQHERYDRLGRIETSDRWKSYGRPAWPMSTGKATAGNTGYFVSSSIRPQSLIPNAPPQYQMFGSVSQQSASLFKQMNAQLKEAGLGYEDVFFMRACLYPGTQSIGKSFSAFNKEYSKYFNNAKNPNRPTRTVMSTPGFNYKKQSISIEYYAAYPEGKSEPLESPKIPVGKNPAYQQAGTLGPVGSKISSDAQLLYISGCIASEKGNLGTEARSALKVLEARLALKDASLEDCVHLRVYFANADPKELDANIATWESIYSEYFATETAPAITVLPVVSLPKGSLIEIEAMAAIE